MNYTTQMDAAKKGIITPEMEIVAKKENITAEELRERVARGSVAIPANKMHKAISPEGVGEGLKTKINVNLGISKDCTDYSIEWEKVKMAVDMKAEAIMDLSCYGKTHEFRQKLIDECPAMIGTVPMYDAVGYLDKELADITADEFLEVIEAHAKEGVDFMTIHAGINRRTAQIFKESGGRLTNIVSRGGSLIFAWMEMTGNENPFFEYYDKVLDILAKYDVSLLDEDTVVLDTRNDYEYDLGHFRGAIRPDIRNFRELPQWVRDHKEEFMDKRVVVYCTGGVRCEKFSGWMVREGYKDVGQLHGGIATYGKDPEVQGELWDGKMYVFDERIAVDINHVDPVVVGKDWFDGTPCERYVNCGNPFCNRRILASEENEDKYLRGCSHECRVHPRNRYVSENGLSQEEVVERLAAIGESLDVNPA